MLTRTDPAEDGARPTSATVAPTRTSDTHDRFVTSVIALTGRTALLALALLAVSGSVSAQHGSGGMMGGGGYGGSGFPGFGLVFWVLLAVGIVVLVAYARDESKSVSPSGSTDRALETLRERYARGELSAEEFERRRTELRRSR